MQGSNLMDPKLLEKLKAMY